MSSYVYADIYLGWYGEKELTEFCEHFGYKYDNRLSVIGYVSRNLSSLYKEYLEKELRNKALESCYSIEESEEYNYMISAEINYPDDNSEFDIYHIIKEINKRDKPHFEVDIKHNLDTDPIMDSILFVYLSDASRCCGSDESTPFLGDDTILDLNKYVYTRNMCLANHCIYPRMHVSISALYS